MALILLVSLLFFWRILFTHQFSMMTMPEIVNQAYSWDQFCASTIQQDSLPLWDPFTHAGRTFVGGRAPTSAMLGAALTLLAFFGSCATCVFLLRSERAGARRSGE
jgi:hypothetical protein